MSGKVSALFRVNDYGYGWLFWFVNIVITFPFYFLSLHGSDLLLISTPRNISLLFMAGSCFLLFKCFKKYSDDKYIPYFAILLFVNYSFFSYVATHFKTTAQITFFCILTFYLIIRNDSLSKRDLMYIALSFAAAIGTKLSGSFIGTVIGYIFDR